MRRLSPYGEVSTLVGSGFPAFADGVGAAASFNGPSGIAVDLKGNVYVSDLVRIVEGEGGGRANTA